MNFDNEALRELADSIRTFGLIQPITVRRKGDGKYQIISGERRYRASIMAGMDMIPAYIRDASEQGMLEMAIVENIQRENLDPIEVAMSYQRLMEECRLTQEQMADRVGKKRASVANQLRLLKLPAKVQHDLKVGLVSVGHAKVLLGVENPALQEALCDAIVKHGLSVRQLEDKIQSLGTKSVSPKAAAEPVELPQMYYRLLENLGRYVGENSLSLRRSKDGKSAITIRFASDSQAESAMKFRHWVISALSMLVAWPLAAQYRDDQFKRDAFTQTYADTTQKASTDTSSLFSFKEFFGGLAGKNKASLKTLTIGSAVFIGSNQIYNRQYWKLPIVYGGIGAGIYGGIRCNQLYKSTQDSKYQTYSILSFVGAGVFYWGSLLDGAIMFKSDKKPDPAKATVYSLLLPGLGQIYNGEAWKLPIYQNQY